MFKLMRTIVLATTAGLMSGSVLADDAALQDFLTKVKSLQAMDAGFEQTTRDGMGQVLQSMTGHLTVAKPGKMRWSTAEPFEQLVISDGEVVWIYDMDLEQVTLRDMDQRVQETPALLLTGDTADVEKSFLVDVEKTSSDHVFQLVPKDPSQLFESLEFHYQGEQISRMMIYDAAGQVTEIAFSNVQVNVPVEPEAFVFNVPEGVDVIDGRHGR